MNVKSGYVLLKIRIVGHCNSSWGFVKDGKFFN